MSELCDILDSFVSNVSTYPCGKRENELIKLRMGLNDKYCPLIVEMTIGRYVKDGKLTHCQSTIDALDDVVLVK